MIDDLTEHQMDFLKLRKSFSLFDGLTDREALELLDKHELTQLHLNFLKIKNHFNVFERLSDEEAIGLIDNITISKYQDGDYVFEEGDRGRDIYYILEGEVAVVINSNVEVATLSRGGFFGEMAFITGEPRSASIRVVTPVAVILSFHIKENIAEINKDAYIAMYHNITKMLTDKIKKANQDRLKQANNS
jgi:CRP-like cAMP-binding protein